VDGMGVEKHRKDLHVMNCKKAETESDVGKFAMSVRVGKVSTAYFY
jgi:hypothetical protein